MVSTLLPRRGARRIPAAAGGALPSLNLSENSPPVRGEHANAVRMPRRVSAEKKREPSHEGSLKNQFFRFRKYPRYITAAAMLQKYAIIYGTSKIFSK